MNCKIALNLLKKSSEKYKNVLHVSTFVQRLASRPSHTFGRRQSCYNSIRSRLGSNVHENGRGIIFLALFKIISIFCNFISNV